MDIQYRHQGIWFLLFVSIVVPTPYREIGATAGSGSQVSNERPSVNYYGTLEDASGHQSSVEHIAIGVRSMTQGIPVYGKLEGCAAYPQDKTTFLNLQDIEMIEVLSCSEKPLVLQGVTYYEIIVTLTCKEGCTAKAQKKFLLESTRKIWCDEQVHGSRAIPQELTLTAIKKITIAGARSTEIQMLQNSADPMLPGRREQRKQHTCNEAAKALDALEKEVNKLPEQHKDTFKELVESIQNWVGGLCSG